jgi:quinol monooxygenase YgiN
MKVRLLGTPTDESKKTAESMAKFNPVVVDCEADKVFATNDAIGFLRKADSKFTYAADVSFTYKDDQVLTDEKVRELMHKAATASLSEDSLSGYVFLRRPDNPKAWTLLGLFKDADAWSKHLSFLKSGDNLFKELISTWSEFRSTHLGKPNEESSKSVVGSALHSIVEANKLHEGDGSNDNSFVGFFKH